MKRTALVSLFLVTGALLPGCPIYGDEGCASDSDCPVAYVCDGTAGLCRPESDIACTQPSECASSETCSSAGLCRVGDCSWPDIGCVAGFECSNDGGLWACVREGSGGGEGGSTSGGAGGASGGSDSATTGGVPNGTGGAT